MKHEKRRVWLKIRRISSHVKNLTPLFVWFTSGTALMFCSLSTVLRHLHYLECVRSRWLEMHWLVFLAKQKAKARTRTHTCTWSNHYKSCQNQQITYQTTASNWVCNNNLAIHSKGKGAQSPKMSRKEYESLMYVFQWRAFYVIWSVIDKTKTEIACWLSRGFMSLCGLQLTERSCVSVSFLWGEVRCERPPEKFEITLHHLNFSPLLDLIRLR